MSFAQILAVLTLVVGVPLNVYVTLKLWRLSASRPDVRALRERAVAAALVLLIVVVFGLIFLNNDTIPPFFGLEVTKIITRVAVLVLAVVPALYLLWSYR